MKNYNTRVFAFTQNLASVSLTTAFTQVFAGGSTPVDAIIVSFTKATPDTGIEIAYGAAASEVVFANVSPNNTVIIPFSLGANNRIAIRAQNGTITSSDISISGWAAI